MYCIFVLFVFVLCTLCCQFLWIVLFWLPLRYSLMFILNNATIFIFNYCFKDEEQYYSCILCCVFVLFFFVLYVASFSGLFLFWLPLRYSLTFIASFSGLFLFWLPFRYSLTFIIFKKKVLEIGLCLVFIVMVRIG